MAIRKRAKKVSKGINAGAKRNKQTPLNLVLMGKGFARNYSLPGNVKYRGVDNVMFGAFDKDQALRNLEDPTVTSVKSKVG